MDATSVRPYFLPDTIKWDELPHNVRAAFDDVVVPAYREYVTLARDPVQRSAGASLVFLLCEELLDQFELASTRIPGGPEPAADRAKAIERYLRLVGAKQKIASFLDRLAKARLAANAD